MRTNINICQKRQYRPSQLIRFRAELVALRKSGASYPQLALWLQNKKRLRVAHTTIIRFLAQLPEVINENKFRESKKTSGTGCG